MNELWHLRPTGADPEWFKDPLFCASALRKMVANCVSLHPKIGLYTDGERKTMIAAAEHLEAFVRKSVN